MPNYARRDIVGGAAATTISGSITSSSTSITIASAAGWPLGSSGEFYCTLERGTANEERILVLSRSGTTLTLASAAKRGVDNTTAVAHSSGATIEHTGSADDLNEANYAVVQTVGKVTTAGDILVASAANAFARLPKGSNGVPLSASGGTVGWNAISAGGIASDAVTTAKILNDAVTAAKIADGAIDAAAKLASDVVETAKILDANVTAAKFAANIGLGFLAGGYAEVTAAQASISTIVDLSSLSVTVTAGTSRRIKVTAHIRTDYTSGGALVSTVSIREGSTTLEESSHAVDATTTAATHSFSWIGTPTAGAHTYKVSAAASTGVMATVAAATRPGYILVEDIGAA